MAPTVLREFEDINEHPCSFDEFLISVEAPSHPKIERRPCKCWTAHFWDCAENPLPELEDVIKASFPSQVEARIVVQVDPEYDDSDAEEKDYNGDSADAVIDNDKTFNCHVLLELKEPLQVTYCDLAIHGNGRHIAEPWSFEPASEQAVLQGKQSGMWEARKGTVIVTHAEEKSF